MAEGPAPSPAITRSAHLRSDSRPVFEATAASAGMVLFALFAHTTQPLFLLAIAGLILTTLAISGSFRSTESLGSLFGLTGLSRPVVWWSIVGFAVGAGLAILFRLTSDRPLLPSGFEQFVVVAAAIGAAEELFYRGYVQGRLSRLGWPAAVILAALAHTAYNTALFAFPPEGLVIQYSTLALLTLLVGTAFGLTRHLCGSVLPALTAHVLFDILVYGDWGQAPWWVWG
jgi:membrane protease YdiL (CAAX protease family)